MMVMENTMKMESVAWIFTEITLKTGVRSLEMRKQAEVILNLAQESIH